MGNSPFGLSDIAGNVSEWTLDRDGIYVGTAGSFVLNSPGPASGTDRVIRGGAWASEEAAGVRAVGRAGDAPANWYEDLGFRCARGAR